jgi:hypothetical protein
MGFPLLPAGPNLQSRKAFLKESRQFFDAAAFRGIMAGQNKGQALRLGGQDVVKTHFPSEENIGSSLNGIGQEVAARATGDGQAFDNPIRLTNQVHVSGLQLGLHQSG